MDSTAENTTVPLQKGPALITGYIFKPADDISVYELYKIVQYMLEGQNALFLPSLLDKMPDECKRHFESSQQSLSNLQTYLNSSRI